MNIFDKVKSWFSKKYGGEVKEQTTVANEQPKKEETPVKTTTEFKSETQPKVEVKPQINREELFEILNSTNIDKNSLALNKIESEAETISSYAKGLIRDLGTYQDLKDDKEKIENAIRGIGGKIKVITSHGLELKNLLGILESHYYEIILEALKKVNEKLNNEGMNKLISEVEGDLNLVRELDSQLTKVIAYNDLFNPDKCPQYRTEIEKEATKRIVHGDLNDLLNRILAVVADKTLGIKAKIEKTNPLDKAKALI